MHRVRVTVVALGTAAATLVAPVSSANGDAVGAPFQPAATTAATIVTLPTGDQVQWSTDATGRQTALVIPSGSSAGYLTLRLAGDLYVIPRAALPSLAEDANLSAFDVSALAQHRPASPPTTDFGSSGRYPMRTLRITGIDELGQPATGLAMFYLIVNVDNGNKFAFFDSMANGFRNMAVPVGHYVVIGFFSRQDKQTGKLDNRIVTIPEINVPSSPGVTAVTLDARSATDTLIAETPRPAAQVIQDVQVDRSDTANTGDISLGYELVGNEGTISVNATAPHAVEHGQLRFYTSWRLAASDGSYTYDLEYPSDGFIPDRAVYSASDDQLATIDANYDANINGLSGMEARFSFLPWQTAAVRIGSSGLRAPAHRTEYVIGNPNIIWVQQIDAFFSPFSRVPTAGAVSDSYRTYLAGEQLSQHWNAPPIMPGVQVDTGANPGGTFVCTACREGNTLRLLIYPFGDNEPGHIGAADSTLPGVAWHESTDFAIFQGSTQLADTAQALGSIDLPADPATYHLVYHNTRTAPWWTLSTDVRTEWTFTSSNADGSGQLPPSWVCGPDGGTDCGIVPLLFARYALPTDSLGTLQPGANTIQFTVDHAQGAPASPVQATLSASYDGGTTWIPAQVTGGDGDQFTAQLDVPPPAQTDGFVALRLHAADANGSALDQTVQRAAAVGTDSTATFTTPPRDVPAAASEPVASADATPACSPAGPGTATCFALVRTTPAPRIASQTVPAGYGPADLQSAYGITAAAAQRGDGQTIGIVDAFDDPAAEADLAVYRAQFGLPPCTTANGCFTKLNQDGTAGSYPHADSGWAAEISLDLDMVSASCPRCRIVLVEANTNATSDLAAAANTAATAGSNVISNSYGTDEFTGMEALEADYRHPGVFVTASSGDSGFTFPSFPAVMPDVAAVGGTSLHPAANARGWTEQAWGNGANSLLGGGAGSGCSGYIAKPAWQHDIDCLMRTTADVSAVADPDTGVAVYDTIPNQFGVPAGWLVVGGTSAASPLVAGIIGLAGNAASLTTADLYHNKLAFNDVVGGSAGYCDGSYLCTGVKGYDGPTGLGSPNGIAGL